MRGRWSTWIEGGVLAAEVILLAWFSVPVWSARVDAFPSELQSTVVRVVAEHVKQDAIPGIGQPE